MAEPLIADYHINPASGAKIELKITIGFAQLGVTSITIDGVAFRGKGRDEAGNEVGPDGKNNYPNSFTVTIGTNESLNGKDMVIASAVERIQPEEAHTSLTLGLKGGKQQAPYKPLTEKVDTVGGWAEYTAIITFKP